MSHETIQKLQIAVQNRGPDVSIFLLEQITTMILNMSTNKKCHNHLSNKNIINFITKIFKDKFYEKYLSKSEFDSNKKTIKNILHIISILINESKINPDILENDVLPIFEKIENRMETINDITNCHSKSLKYLNKKLNDSLIYKNNNNCNYENLSSNNNKTTTATANSPNINKLRQESFV